MSGEVIALEIRTTTDRTYDVTLANCEPRPVPYSKMVYRPTRLLVVKRDGGVKSTQLSGPRVKKDGSDGANWATEKFYGQRDWPDYLKSIVGGLA